MKITWVALVCAALLAGVPTATASHVPGAPVNDDYFESLKLNEDGSRLERRDTLKDVRDTTQASVQSDVLSPGPGGGPPEVTSCKSSSYGKTVWYDFFPDVNGTVRLRASGFNTVLSVIPFNRRTATPNFAGALCVDESPSTTEEFLVSVKGRSAYSVQIGGVDNAFGGLEFLFDFLPDTDADGVLDDVDRCKSVAGEPGSGGCPLRVRADAVLRARPTANGIQVLSLTIDATRDARVEVTCSRGCKSQVRKAGLVKADNLRGRNLTAGSKIEVRATKPRSIGAYISYKVLRGDFKKTVRCTNPGSRQPRKKCG